MEVKGATLLYTLAGLMITFAGVSALFLGLRQAAGEIPCKNGHDVHFRIDGGGAAAGAICALRHSGKVDLARLWCAFRTTDAVSSAHLSAPTPQGDRPL